MKTIKLFTAILITAMTLTAQVQFYGTTKIQAPAGTQIDLRNDARYRIFARDAQGFDISEQITIDGDNWTRVVPATITYSAAGQTREVELVAQAGNQLIQRTLYSLSRTAIEAIQSGEMPRGDNHDRQHLGVFMPAGSTLKVRRVSPASGAANWDILVFQGRGGPAGDRNRYVLKLDITNNEWTTLSGTTQRGGLPLIRTPRTEDLGGQPAIIEVEISGGVNELHYFHYGDNTADFLARWQGNHFALIGSSAVNLMVSQADRINGRFTTGEFANDINSLLDMYSDVLGNFNKWIGLDINAQEPIDRLLNSKFLVVPFVGGAGYAFYNEDFCGYSVGDVNGELGSYLARGWVVFHELGHGYDRGRIRNKEMPLVDVKNNILSTYFQMTYLDFTNDAQRRTTWLFGGNNTPSVVDARVVQQRTGSFSSIKLDGSNHFADRLYLMLTMTNAAGNFEDATNALAEVNRLNRRHDWSLADLWTMGLNNSAKTNIIPFVKSFGFSVSDNIKMLTFENESRIAQPLRDLTSANINSHLFPADGRLLWGSLSMVKPGELELGSGTATITINIDDLDKVRGKTLKIKDGAKVIHEAEITSNTISVPSIAAGAYYMEFPASSDRLYITGYHELIIKNGEDTKKAVSYEKVNYSPAASAMEFYLECPTHAWVFRATISYDAANGRIISRGSGQYSNGGWSNWGRINMEILRNGSRRHYVDYNVAAGFGLRYLDVRVGDEIVINHNNPTNIPSAPFSEATRGLPVYRAVNTLTGEMNTTDFAFDGTTLTLVITERGIFKKGTTEAKQQEMHAENFELALNETKKDAGARWAVLNAFKDIKAAYLWGANLLSEADRERIMKDFDPCDCGTCEACKPATSIASTATTASATGIKFAQNIVSDRAEISVILPNASTGSATAATETRIVIYDMTGNVVFEEKTTNRTPVCSVIWDLRNSAGRFVANGTYLVIAEVRNTDGRMYQYSARLGVKR